MEHSHRSHSLRFLALTTLLVLGSVLGPAADFVSAAGLLVEGGLQVAPPVASADEDLDVDLSYTVFLPIIVRRWPPIPYAANLAPTQDTVWDAPITLDLQADVPTTTYPVDYYVLEEARSADFSEVTSHTVLTTSIPYEIAKPLGTMDEYFYRVRAHNVWGLGEWSTPASLRVLTYLDQFENPSTGWTLRRTSYHLLDKMPSWYADGNYHTVVGDKYDFAIFAPMQPAPALPYVIKMRTRVVQKANETSFGIVFGGNGGTHCGIALPEATDPNGCFFHYYRLNVIWGGYLKYGLTRIDAHEGHDGKGLSGDYGGYSALDWYEASTNNWNDWEIRVYDSGYELYVNDHFLKAIPDPTYVNEPYYGIYGSNYEYNGGHFEHEYFFVAPLDIAPRVLSAAVLAGEPQ